MRIMRITFALFMLICLGIICENVDASEQEGGRKVVVDGVESYRVDEPLFECVRIVLSHRGEEYSPAYIQGISGAAFRVAGPCLCAPTSSFALETTELVEMMGYEMEHLNLAVEGIVPGEEVHNVVTRVKEEIRAGRPVVVWHAFTYAEWDVVCGFDDEKKQFLGYGSYRGNDDELAAEDETRMATCLDICPAFGAILIGDKVREFDAREAELSALEEAIRHAHSTRDRFLEEAGDVEKPWRFREGLACYDIWIDNFRVNPNRIPERPHGGDNYCLGWCRSTHAAAAEFMRELAAKYPEVKENFLRAAHHFELDSELLCEIGDKVFKEYKEANPERAKRAVELFTKARNNYAQGINEIEKALQKIAPERIERARNPARIQRENGKVWIKNVRNLKFKEGQDCTFAGAITEAMRVTEHPYVYSDVMGLSGLAFRVRWCNEDTKTKWCSSCAIGEMPDEQTALAELTGWNLPTEWLSAENRDNEKLREKIVASIDAGKPVVAYPEGWNMAVVYGYEDDGRMLLLSDYMENEFPSRLPVERLGPLQTYLGDYAEPSSLRDGLLAVLQTAVLNWKRERHHGGLEDREYWYGKAAFSAWIKDLQGFDTLTEETQKALIGIDWWNYTSLYDARKAAVEFLKDWSNVLDGERQQALGRAMVLYEQETKVLEPLLADKRESGEEQDWSAEARLREIEVLTEALKLESRAIAEIESAL